MKKKNKRWYKLSFILPASIILPPLGFFLLWRSPRKLIHKTSVSVICVLMLAGIAFGALKTGVYARLMGPEIPASGYAVEKDSRNRYIISEILPLEGKVFSAVVHELRRQPNMLVTTSIDESTSLDMIQPEAIAFEKVSAEFGIPYEDVGAIYYKVSSQINQNRK